MKIERLLAMTIMLLNRRKVTAKELSEYFGVSVRTIYRDVETLNHSGIPVVSWQGYEGGFCISDNYKLSRQLLTFDDMLSILTTLKGINKTLKNRDIDNSIEKISALIPEDKEEAYQTHSDSFIIDISPWGANEIHEQVVQTVHQAIGNSLLISFKYVGANGKESERIVEPHTLVMKSFSWYLLAFCKLRNEFRVFRLQRMHNVEISNEHFVRREVAYAEYFMTDNDKRKREIVSIKFNKNVKQRITEIFNNNQLTIKSDGSIIVEFETPIDDWIYSLILNFGENAEVLSPEYLRVEVAKKIKKMNKIYSNMT